MECGCLPGTFVLSPGCGGLRCSCSCIGLRTDPPSASSCISSLEPSFKSAGAAPHRTQPDSRRATTSRNTSLTCSGVAASRENSLTCWKTLSSLQAWTHPDCVLNFGPITTKSAAMGSRSSAHAFWRRNNASAHSIKSRGLRMPRMTNSPISFTLPISCFL